MSTLILRDGDFEVRVTPESIAALQTKHPGLLDLMRTNAVSLGAHQERRVPAVQADGSRLLDMSLSGPERSACEIAAWLRDLTLALTDECGSGRVEAALD